MSRTVVPDRQLSPWDQAPFWQPIRETVVHVLAAGWTQVCGSEMGRTAVLFQVAQATDAYISTQQPVALSGVHLLGADPPYELWNSIHGPLTTVAWYGRGNGAPTDITVIEVLLAKWPGEE